VREGDSFDFHRWQQDRERLLALYHGRDFLEATVDASREPQPAEGGVPRILLRYTITRGPRTEIEVNGAPLPGDVTRGMRELWTTSVFDGFLTEDLARRGRLALVGRGHLRASASARIVMTAEGDSKRAIVDLEPGPAYRSREVVFGGSQALSRGALVDALAQESLHDQMWIDPRLAVNVVRQAFANAGFLDARVEAVGPVFEGDAAKLTFRVTEGPRYAVALTAVEGAAGIPETEVRQAARGEEAGVFCTPEGLDALLGRVERLYRREGFNAVRVEARPVVRREAAAVDVALAIVEGPRQVLAGIDVEGAERTHPRVVERALDLEIGTPANLAEWTASQRRLYDAGVFRLADIEPAPVGAAVPAADGKGTEQPVRAKVILEEWPSLRVRYGVLLSDTPAADTDARNREPGVVAELQQRNLFGRTVSAGLGGRYERNFRVGRAYVAAPRLFGLPLLSNVYVAFQRRVLNEEGALPFADARQSAGAEQRLRLGMPLEVSWNLSLERDRVYSLDPDPDDPFPLDLTVTLARAATSMAYDRRDDPFDSTRGWLHTANVEYAAVALGDESLFGGARFLKYTGQQFVFVPVWKGIVLATAGRVGLANGMGQDLVFSERFRLGGSTTVRGYPDESLGPRDVFGIPEGGEALVLLNQEVRFPIYGWLRGVTFLDAGNVFARPSAIDLGKLDVGAGVGLRVATPYLLVRVDFGVPLSRGLGFKDGRWYFSIGQAF
jgi:outer membrane protein assembly factor BamA